MDRVKISEELDHNISGNASPEAKELVQHWLYFVKNNGFGMRTASALELVEVSIVPHVDEPTERMARVVLEMTVTQDMTNGAGAMHSACIVHLVDICTMFPIVVMSFVDGGKAMVGASQDISVVHHAPARLGDRLRLINTSVAIGTRTWSARIEIWDVTHGRLVASATQIKMEIKMEVSGTSSKL